MVVGLRGERVEWLLIVELQNFGPISSAGRSAHWILTGDTGKLLAGEDTPRL
jgi:hypothetical protein